MLPYREHRFGTIALIIFFVLLISYAVYEFYATALGPHITVPNETIVVQEPYTLIRGEATNIAELQMNGSIVSVTEAGVFQEPYMLNPGKNTVVLDARDNFGRTRREVIQIIYTPPNTASTAR